MSATGEGNPPDFRPQHVRPPSLAVLGGQSPALALKHADGHRYFTVAPKRWTIATFGTWRISGWRALAGGSYSEFGLPAEGYPKKHVLPRRVRKLDSRTSRAFQLPLLCIPYGGLSTGGRHHGRSSGESWLFQAWARGHREINNPHRHTAARVRPVIEFETGRWRCCLISWRRVWEFGQGMVHTHRHNVRPR